MKTAFFMPMAKVPTVTHQEKQVRVIRGKPQFYEPERLRAARSKLEAYLASFAPDVPLGGPVRLVVKWCFPLAGKHRDGEWKISKPDTDNLQKLLKDCMTKLGYWKDDAQVCSEVVEKFWAKVSGLYIEVIDLEDLV